jgi:hypothetical protein
VYYHPVRYREEKLTKNRPTLKTWIPQLLEARENNLNEADTLARITKVFEEVLGYDPLNEISREAQLKGKYIDLAIKIDGVIRLLVEAKAAGVLLRDRHIEQAEGYAARNNYRWVLLTNGVMWNLYHLTFEEGIEYERVFSIDLTEDTPEVATEKLALLSRDSIRKQILEKYWEQQCALSPAVIGKYLFKEKILRLLRREIRKELGFLVDVEDLAVAVRGMLSPEAREMIGPRHSKVRQRKTNQTPENKTRKTREKPSDRTVKINSTIGSVLKRVYKGKEYVCTVVQNGFEYEGKVYRSLTAVAKTITGYKAISGTDFFKVKR